MRDFIRGLCLSDTFTRTFYGFNSNYKVVRHLVERLLGRKTSGKGEELSWSIVIATKGVAGMVDALLDSEEYLDNFGFDTVPYQRHRVLPGRDLGDTPFNITTPATTSTTATSLASSNRLHRRCQAAARARTNQAWWQSRRLHGFWKHGCRQHGRFSSSTSGDYMARVPYRSIGR